MSPTHLQSANWPTKFHGYNSSFVFSSTPTKLKFQNMHHIPMAAGMEFKLKLYDTNWTNWDYTSYNWEFGLSTGYHFNIAKNYTLSKVPFEETDVIYKAYCQSLFAQLKEHLGSTAIQRDNRLIFDNGIYLEYDSTIKENCEYCLCLDFSKISTNKRVKLHRRTQPIHKTGTSITLEKFFEMLQSKIDQDYKIIMEQFEHNLKT